MRLIFPRAECTELAAQDAMIRIVDVKIVDVRADIAVLPFANDIRDHPERVEVAGLVELQTFRFADAFPFLHLPVNRPQIGWDEFFGN